MTPVLLALLVGLIIGALLGAAVAINLLRHRATSTDAAAAETQALLAQRADAELAANRAAVESLVSPIRDSLSRVDAALTTAQRDRISAHVEIREEVRRAATAGESLRAETARLSTALRRSEVRGRWGEVQLRRLIEHAGLLDRVHFVEQDTVNTDEGRLRPDLIIKLAEDRQIIVDAKVPLNAYLDAVACDDETERARLLDKHASELAAHVNGLSSKDYARHYDSPDFVVLFLPAESFLSAALDARPSLLDDAFSKNVIIATPTTLLALLRTVALGWRQEALAQHAQEVLVLGKELHSRLVTYGRHISAIGNSLDTAVGHYNKAVASLEGRVFVSTRRFRDLGVTQEDLPEVTTVTTMARKVSAPELTDSTATDLNDQRITG